MRRVLAVLAASVVFVALTGCDPAPTITATPSTLVTECEGVTTVTGKATPRSRSTQVVVDAQVNGKWAVWQWYRSGDSGEQRRPIGGPTNPDGTFSFTYYHPHHQVHTLRMRVRGQQRDSDETGPVSKSWYITNNC